MSAVNFDAGTHEARIPPDARGIAELRERLEYLPDAMRQARRWLLWKPGKVPCYVSGTQRNGTLDTPHDVAQLATLDDALGRLEADSRFAGLGFALGFDAALGAHWQGLDLDDALDPAGQFTTERARQLYQTSDGYAEVSPSGRGLHVIGLGERFRAIKWHRPGEQKIELYAGARFFTVTGRMMREGDPIDLAPLAERVRAALVAAGKMREHKAREHVNGSAEYLERAPENLRAWIKAHPIEAALTEHGYQRIGDRWLSPRSESGVPGVTVHDEWRAVTFHASDAGIGTEVKGDGEVFNAFDAAVRYAFGGDRNRAMRELLPRTGQEAPGGAQTDAEDAEHQSDADDALRPVGFRSFVAALEPPTYAVDGLLIRGYCYSFTGPSGHGKTAIAMNLASVKAVGEPFAGHETVAERVLYVAGENPDDVRMRALAQAGALRLSPDVLEDRLQFIDRSFALGDRHAELMKVIEAGGFGMVILDTDQALSSDADENSNAERIEHAKRVRMLTKTAPRPTVIDLCHPPVNAGRNVLRPRGGSSFLAEIDGNAGVWMDDGDTRAELFRTPKFRGPMFEPLLFDIKVIELAGLADSKGRPMTTAIALPADEADTEADEAARRRRLSLLADISLHPGSTVRERATRTGSPTTTVYRDLRYLLSKGAINEAMDGHEITSRGKKWLAAS